MDSSSAFRSRIFRNIAIIFFIVFLVVMFGPIAAFIVGGSAAMASFNNILTLSPSQLRYVSFPLLFVGVVLIAVSFFYSRNVYKDAVGKVHKVYSLIRGDNIGLVKFEGIRLRVMANMPIQKGDFVKGTSTKYINYTVRQTAGGTDTVATSLVLMVEKVDSEQAYEIAMENGSQMDEKFNS